MDLARLAAELQDTTKYPREEGVAARGCGGRAGATYRIAAMVLAGQATAAAACGRAVGAGPVWAEGNARSSCPMVANKSEREVYIEALRCGGNSSLTCTSLGDALTADETVILHDGRTLNKRELYIEALRVNGDNAHAAQQACHYTGPRRRGDGDADDGRTLSKRELFEAFRCTEDSSQAVFQP